MENKVIYVRGCRVELDTSRAAKTPEEKQAIVDRVSRIILKAEARKNVGC